MKDLLEVQLEAIEALQAAEERIEVFINIICLGSSKAGEDLAMLRKTLRELVAISTLYGKVQIRHEILLKDDTTNTEKEG
jgi:hypothetical protein